MRQRGGVLVFRRLFRFTLFPDFFSWVLAYYMLLGLLSDSEPINEVIRGAEWPWSNHGFLVRKILIKILMIVQWLSVPFVGQNFVLSGKVFSVDGKIIFLEKSELLKALIEWHDHVLSKF